MFVMTNLKINYSLTFFIFFILSLIYQIKVFKINDSKSCLKAFKINNISGFMVFLSLFLLTVDI